MVIDFAVTPPRAPFFDLFLNPPAYLEGYRHLYAEQLQTAMTMYNEPFDRFLSYLDRCGVSQAVVSGKDIETSHGRVVPNDAVARLVAEHPDRFIGFASADPGKGMTAVRDLSHAVTSLGLRGLALEPFEFGLPPNDKKYYPLYAKCCELGIPVSIHTSINFGMGLRMEPGRPTYLDEVAVDFPELTIIAMTAGWPWVSELVGVAWRNPNVYIQIAAVRPRYLAVPNTGWGELLHYGNTVLQDKILFASAWPLLPLDRSIAEVRELPLKPTVIEKWLWRNAARVLELPTGDAPALSTGVWR